MSACTISAVSKTRPLNVFRGSTLLGKNVYRPRNPRATKLYQLVSNNIDEFLTVYPQAFEEKYGFLRPEVVQTLKNYLHCGILSHGFARIKCEDCHHEFLLAFSCKGRYFCPSCHQRRVLSTG